MNEIKQGDKVTHWSHGDTLGTVVEIEQDRYHNACTYGVAWSEGGPVIPYYSVTTTLKKVTDGGE